jgi:malonate-semialdehyde dehydrogenase (acetylating)/methylmalonate-semialdehyde dehydrogenase
VGSTPVAKYIYARASASGKRVQCQGGAKNHVVVLPDADMESTTQIVSDSAFGCAGQRCLAVSVAITVGEAHRAFRDAISESAGSLKVGPGLEESSQMGPVITRESKTRIEHLIDRGKGEGATVLLDGRGAKVPNHEQGNFIKPTLLENVPPGGELSKTEIFGPVLSLIHAETVDEALEILSKSLYGNAASIFTTSGAAARKFRYEVEAGNVGINIGVAAPMAYFPFSGWKDSFLGVVHSQGRDAVEFYTEKKVVIERWPKLWSRKF